MNKHITDAHVHIAYVETKGPCKTFSAFMQDCNGAVDKAVVFLNPIYCGLYPQGERVSVKDCGKDKLMFVKETDPKVLYMGADPYRYENLALLYDCKGHKNIMPYLYLAMSNNTMKQELAYFDRLHKGEFFGIKVHPNLCNRKMSELNFDSPYPMIVHCGISENDNPMDIVEFAKRYSGNICFAHCARFNVEALMEIAKLPNAYIDISPLYMLEGVASNGTDKYYASDITNGKNVTNLVRNIINIIGADKIIFGSDYPWGKLTDAQKLYDELDLNDEVKDKIFYKNFERFNVLAQDNQERESQSDNAIIKSKEPIDDAEVTRAESIQID